MTKSDEAMSETWRAVAGFEDSYEVSDAGRVRSKSRWIESSNGAGPYRRYQRGQLRAQMVNDTGHHWVGLWAESRQRIRWVHRLVLTAFVGPCPDGMVCRHLNGQPSDNRLSNLRWGSPSENAHDSVRHGTHAKTRRATCPRGHPLSEPNLQPGQQRAGRRACWACAIAKDLRRTALRNGCEFDFAEVADDRYQALLGGWRPAPKAERRSCLRGHPLATVNLVPTSYRLGVRQCLACARARSYARVLRERGVTPDLQRLSDAYWEELQTKAAGVRS